MAEPSFHTEFLEQILFRLEENPPRIANCLARLTEAQVWERPHSSANSIANLILHLCGNIRQYAISSLGGQPDMRVRDAEFAAREGLSKAELLRKLEETVAEAVRVARAQDADSLLRVRQVQGFSLSGIGILIHVAEHLSYHTGQIAWYTKTLTQQDLGFYAGLNLNVPNTPD